MTQSKYRTLLKISGLYGILIPFTAFIFIFLAIVFDPLFSWTNNALSDLGVVTGITSGLFNSGLIITGVWALIFAVGLLISFKKNIIGQASAFMFASASLALLLIGIFNESYEAIHYLVSVAFFVLLPISLFIVVAAFAIAHRAKMAIFTLSIALSAALPWILYFMLYYAPNVAIPEFVSGLAGSIWTVVLGYQMMKETTLEQVMKNYIS